MKKLYIIYLILFLIFFFSYSFGAEDKSTQNIEAKDKGKSAVQRIIFEEQKIEGKIRRPQLVLIKADQRPNFPPMVMQSIGNPEDITSLVDTSVFEEPSIQKAFKFKGKEIVNLKP